MRYILLIALIFMACNGWCENWEEFNKDVAKSKYPKQYIDKEEKCDNSLWPRHLWITNPGWDRCFHCGKTKPNNWKPKP